MPSVVILSRFAVRLWDSNEEKKMAHESHDSILRTRWGRGPTRGISNYLRREKKNNGIQRRQISPSMPYWGTKIRIGIQIPEFCSLSSQIQFSIFVRKLGYKITNEEPLQLLPEPFSTSSSFKRTAIMKFFTTIFCAIFVVVVVNAMPAPIQNLDEIDPDCKCEVYPLS